MKKEKGKFSYKIESLISASHLHKNKDTIRKIKSCTLIHPTDSYELVQIISMLSRDFNNIPGYFELKILTININIFYDYNEVNSDSDE